ncbi:DUF4347 domain-containing protein [Thiorhodovibrio frisius]|nr:DUF4347 domain-containing protein [Thiorhodovibrio frisius]
MNKQLDFNKFAQDLPAKAGLPPEVTVSEPSSAAEILFIDAAVPDAEQLASGVRDGVEVVWLSSDQPALGQIAAHLTDRAGLGAIHIVSHGSAGTLNFAAGAVDVGSLRAEGDALATIGGSLSDDGDILLYGCDLAADDAGLAFIDALAEATGADVAASDDRTGAADLGGDWDLETTTGPVESAGAVTAQAMAGYGGVLAGGTFDFTGATTPTQTVAGITVWVTAWNSFGTETGGLGINSDKVYDTGNTGASLIFDFSHQVDVSSFLVGFYSGSNAPGPFQIRGMRGGEWVESYSPQPGYSDLYGAWDAAPAYTVDLSGGNNWGLVEKIEVRNTTSGSASFMADTIIFTSPDADSTAPSVTSIAPAAGASAGDTTVTYRVAFS